MSAPAPELSPRDAELLRRAVEAATREALAKPPRLAVRASEMPDVLGLSASTVRRLRLRGGFPPPTLDERGDGQQGAVLYAVTDLKAWINLTPAERLARWPAPPSTKAANAA